MKKVVFKWITTTIDFETKEEAEKYINNLKKKGVNFVVIIERWTSNDTFGNGKPVYTLEYATQYNKNYNSGF